MTKATQKVLRKIVVYGMGIAGLVMLCATWYKWMMGVEIDYFGEILSISIIWMMFFSALTWGSKDEEDKFAEHDELGQLIIAKSAKISYFLLLAVMVLILVIEHLVYDRDNISLIIALGLGLILLPATEWVISRKYK